MDAHAHRDLMSCLGKPLVLALLVTLALPGQHTPSAYAACNIHNDDCLPDPDDDPPPPPPPPVKKDYYCAYPVLTSATVSDAHESGVTGPWGYMYFSSASSPKTDNYASSLGTGPSTVPAGTPPQTQYYYDTNAWASNFKGPHAISGESSRTQWEWSDPTVESQGSQTAFYGSKGTPYVYGRQCFQVSVGANRPSMGYKSEYVYEDDECLGPFCNPDDHVGGFRISRQRCETDVWSRGYLTGWTYIYTAVTWGDIVRVGYKLWCYACLDATGCTTGVGPSY